MVVRTLWNIAKCGNIVKCGNCTNQTSRKGETNKKEEEEEGGKRRTTLTLKTGPAAKATCGVRWMGKRVSISVEHAHKAVLIMERTIILEKYCVRDIVQLQLIVLFWDLTKKRLHCICLAWCAAVTFACCAELLQGVDYFTCWYVRRKDLRNVEPRPKSNKNMARHHFQENIGKQEWRPRPYIPDRIFVLNAFNRF